MTPTGSAISKRWTGVTTQDLVLLSVLLAPVLVEAIWGPIAALAVLVMGAGGAVLATSSGARLAASVLGGLLTFQSPSGMLKLSYLGVTGLCVALSLRDLVSHAAGREVLRVFRPFLVAGSILIGYFIVSLPVAVAHETSALNWARDASPYLSAIAMPIIGLQAGTRLKPRTLLLFFLAAGVASTASFVIQWVSNRGLSALGRVAYGDNFLSASLFCLCLAFGAGGTRRWASQLAAAACFGCLLLTGNRSLIVLLLAFVGVVGSPEKMRMPVAAVLRSVTALVIGVAIVLRLSFAVIPGERELLLQRVNAAQTYLATGEDQSARGRAMQARLAWEQVRENLVFGTGPGFLYTDPYFVPNVSDPRKGHRDSFVLDTPLDIPAKLGLTGLLLLLAWMAAGVASVRKWIELCGPTVVGNAARAFAVVVVAFTPFGVTLEQKGFALTLMLFAAALVSQRLVSRETTYDGSPRDV